MVTLRDYQVECVQRVLAAYQSNPAGEELIVLPTGSGKTVVFSEVIHRLNSQHGINTLIIAHRDELLDQAAEKYRQIKPTAIIGKVGSGIHEYGGEVTVASIATIARKNHLQNIKAIGYGLVIVDECHHSEADSYKRVLEALPNAFVLGVTATQDRLDKKALFGGKEPLYQASIIDMIKRGYLVDMRAIAIRTEVNLDEIKTTAGDFNQGELDEAVNTPARNIRVVNAYKEHALGRRAICFGVTVAHASALMEAFLEAGIPASLVEGNTPIDERKQIYAALRHGTIKVLCNVQVLTEGYDEPLVDAIIMARPTQSRSLFVQCIGRGLRLAPSKKDCIILDITDNCMKHRLMPVTLKKFFHLPETPAMEDVLITEALEEKENAEKEAQVRKLKDRRKSDLEINLMEDLEWKELPSSAGSYVMTVGPQKHRIALIEQKNTGMYRVCARLAPVFQAQYWSGDLTLEWAQQFAEREAHKLLSAGNAVLVDRDASWRKTSPSEGQMKFLRWKKIPFEAATITKGEASELIDKWKQEDERKKAEKAKKEEEKAQRKMVGVY